MDGSDLSNDLDVAHGLILATLFSLSLWSVTLMLWYLLASHGG
jgi:hypothetical protein